MRAVSLGCHVHGATLGDLVRNERGVLTYTANQRRRHGMLESEACEVKSSYVHRDAAPVPRVAVITKHREADPTIVRFETGAPQDHSRVDDGAFAVWQP